MGTIFNLLDIFFQFENCIHSSVCFGAKDYKVVVLPTSFPGFTCCVPGCFTNNKRNLELSFYNFPYDKIVEYIWSIL